MWILGRRRADRVSRLLRLRVSGTGGVWRRPRRAERGVLQPDLHEFVLPYDAVRTAADPDRALLEFLQSTYVAAADLASWDRAALESSFA